VIFKPFGPGRRSRTTGTRPWWGISTFFFLPRGWHGRICASKSMMHEVASNHPNRASPRCWPAGGKKKTSAPGGSRPRNQREAPVEKAHLVWWSEHTYAWLPRAGISEENQPVQPPPNSANRDDLVLSLSSRGPPRSSRRGRSLWAGTKTATAWRKSVLTESPVLAAVVRRCARSPR